MASSDSPLQMAITGAGGNLARQLIARIQQGGLRGRRCQFHLTDLQPLANWELGADMHFDALDLADTETLQRWVAERRPDFLLHFGSLLSGACEQNLERAWQINATASIALLEAANTLPGCVFFFPSTGATYGPDSPDPLPEDHPQWPANFYGVAKVAIERAGAYFHLRHGLDFRGLRFPMILSPFAPAAAVSAYASRAIMGAKSGKPFVFPVSPETGISTIYVKDVMTGIVRFLGAPRERLTRRVYNLHSFGPTAAEIAATIREHVPDFAWSFSPDPLVDGLLRSWPRVHIDASARADWGWAPQFDLAATVSDMLPA